MTNLFYDRFMRNKQAEKTDVLSFQDDKSFLSPTEFDWFVHECVFIHTTLYAYF